MTQSRINPSPHPQNPPSNPAVFNLNDGQKQGRDEDGRFRVIYPNGPLKVKISGMGSSASLAAIPNSDSNKHLLIVDGVHKRNGTESSITGGSVKVGLHGGGILGGTLDLTPEVSSPVRTASHGKTVKKGRSSIEDLKAFNTFFSYPVEEINQRNNNSGSGIIDSDSDRIERERQLLIVAPVILDPYSHKEQEVELEIEAESPSVGSKVLSDHDMILLLGLTSVVALLSLLLSIGLCILMCFSNRKMTDKFC
jgi:hypothetical protein